MAEPDFVLSLKPFEPIHTSISSPPSYFQIRNPASSHFLMEALLSSSSSSSGVTAKYSIPPPGRLQFTGQSVRPIPIRILTVGKKRSPGVQLIVDDYVNKLSRYCSVESVRVKSNPKNARDPTVQIEHEDQASMRCIKSQDEWVVVLDERGMELDSVQMASFIGNAANDGAPSLLFCIGGPYGHGRLLRRRANVSIKLSSLVFNHEVALVVLMEQLYRAWTILKGHKYHH